jgi:hypothetical protein
MKTIAQKKTTFSFLQPIRNWIDNLRIDRLDLAYSICKLIPAQCPFEREIYLGNLKILLIPPMCKFNPLYEELVGLRFKALCYLADECGEDISHLLA